MNPALAEKMEMHSEAGRRFFELGQVSDPELLALYQGARAANVPSVAEGFGLPIFDAANLGTPLILSDVEVFQELAGTDARYFARGSSQDLYRVLYRSLYNDDWLRPSGPISPPRWRDFYRRLMSFMDGNENYHVF